MRPPGEIRQALIDAAHQLVAELGRPNGGATLAELAARSCVGRDAARCYVDNMRRAGVLKIVGQRRVQYRNRPVAEYAPAQNSSSADTAPSHLALCNCMQSWVK